MSTTYSGLAVSGESSSAMAYLADRKPFPLGKWNLACRRLRSHYLIDDDSVMTTESSAPGAPISSGGTEFPA
jgi:hypothetical protein